VSSRTSNLAQSNPIPRSRSQPDPDLCCLVATSLGDELGRWATAKLDRPRREPGEPAGCLAGKWTVHHQFDVLRAACYWITAHHGITFTPVPQISTVYIPTLTRRPDTMSVLLKVGRVRRSWSAAIYLFFATRGTLNTVRRLTGGETINIFSSVDGWCWIQTQQFLCLQQSRVRRNVQQSATGRAHYRRRIAYITCWICWKRCRIADPARSCEFKHCVSVSTVQSVFRYLELFRRDPWVWRTDRRTDSLIACAALQYVARTKKLWIFVIMNNLPKQPSHQRNLFSTDWYDMPIKSLSHRHETPPRMQSACRLHASLVWPRVYMSSC